MAKYDAKAQLAEQKKKSQDIEEQLKHNAPYEEGVYLTNISSYKTINGLDITYLITAEDEFNDTNSRPFREFYSSENLPMFFDKHRDMIYLFNLAHDLPVTTTHDMPELVGFEFAANLINNKKDGKSYWRLLPIIPEETE